MHSREEQLKAFGELLDVLDTLREQCPWDRKQTNESLRTNTIEEVFELSDAIVRNDAVNICKELGDVLMHVMFYARIGSETDQFDIADVCRQQTRKLIYRHPHIYPPEEQVATAPAVGDVSSKAVGDLQSAVGDLQSPTPTTAEDVLHNWEQIKLREKGGNRSVLAGVPGSLPSLIKAYRIQDKVRNYGFDWQQREDVWDKVHEELDELKAELANHDDARAEEELGDFLFSIINAARLYHINPDTALEKTNKKFIQRFNYIEEQAKQQGKQLNQLTLEEMDRWWNEAKKQNLPSTDSQ